MARLGIEDKFFSEDSRWRKLARIMGWTEAQAIGHLVFLWHSSQDEEEHIADGDDICDWARLDIGTDETKFLNALCHKRVRYTDLLPSGKYLIRGNRDHIKVLQAYRNRAKRTNAKRLDRKIARLQGSERPTLQAAERPPDDTRNDLEDGQRHTNANANANANATLLRNVKGVQGEEGPSTLSLGEEGKNSIPPSKGKENKPKSNPKPKTKTWAADNPFSGIFTLLNQLKPYKLVFDTPVDEKSIRQWMDSYQINKVTLQKEVTHFVSYYHGKNMKSPRGALAGWLKRSQEKYGKQHGVAKPELQVTEDLNGAVF